MDRKKPLNFEPHSVGSLELETLEFLKLVFEEFLKLVFKVGSSLVNIFFKVVFKYSLS